MKELCLHAFFDRAARGAGRQEVARWLVALARLPDAGGTPFPARLLCDDGVDGIEIWLPDAAAPSAEGVAAYRRVFLRPVREEEDGARWRIRVELPADVAVCASPPLSELVMAGSVPQRVAMDGRVFPFEELTMEQMRRMDEGRAVLAPGLAASLGMKLRRGRKISYAELPGEVERRLSACFPGGGEAAGCPLHVDLRLPDVPACRLFRVPPEQRRLRFGRQGEAALPREGLERYGAFEASPRRLLTVVMLYPEGSLEDARRLFRLLFPIGGLIGAMPSGREDGWVAYRTDGMSGDAVVDGLMASLYAMQAAGGGFTGGPAVGPIGSSAGGPAGNRLYCYIPPEGSAGALLREAGLLVRLRRLVRLFGSLFLGPVPLRGIDAASFGWRLPSVAAGLLVQMGGVPWVSAEAAGRDGVLFAGLSCSGFRRGGEEFCAGGFWQPSLLRCADEVCCPLSSFAVFFVFHFRMVCERFARGHEGSLPERVVVYCHHDVPHGLLSGVAAELARQRPVVPVTLARVRRLADASPCCYASGAEGGMPPAGTCLHGGDGRMLLFCREALPALGKRGVFHPAPLEVRFDALAADGDLQPLPVAEAERLAAETCRQVWMHPAYVDGSALPSVLSCVDGLARRRYQEWLVEEADRRVILEGSGDLAF